MSPPRPSAKFSREERGALVRIYRRSRSRRIILNRREMGRKLYGRTPPSVPRGQGLLLGESGLQATFWFADRPVVQRRRYLDLEAVFVYPPDPEHESWEDVFPPGGRVEAIQLETYDGLVCPLELDGHNADLVMAVLKDRLEDRWPDVFQGGGGYRLPPSYWGRYHKLIFLEPGRDDWE